MKTPATQTKRCRTCGKEFTVYGGEWGYTSSDLTEYRKKYFCSYSCLRKYEIPHLAKVKLPTWRTHLAQKRASTV